MQFWNLASVTTVLVLSTSVNAATIIGSLSHESGDVFVSDSLNNVEWMHFSEAGFDASRSSLEAKFSDKNSELFGFRIANANEAVKFAMAAFGVTPSTNNTAQSFSNLNGGWFTSVMGDAYTANDNNIWVHEADTPGLLNFSYIAQNRYATDYVHNYTWRFSPYYSADMTYLAVRDITAVPVPTAVWLFGSGLIGLIGFARRKKS